MHKRLLLVDDENEKLNLMQDFLRREFFEVATAANGVVALQVLEVFNPDLVLLDVHMPYMDGLETCRQMRRRPGYEFGGNKRILMFSDKRVDLVDRVSGLDLGADRYLVRPVAPRELLAEIHALLRSIPTEPALVSLSAPTRGWVIAKGRLEIWLDEHLVLIQGERRTLPELSFRLLVCLANQLNQAVAKDELIAQVWGYPESDEVLTTAINRLRNEIEPDPRRPQYLQTVRRYGYKLVSGTSNE